jgi:hypothetical protein
MDNDKSVSIYERLPLTQTELKAPKGQRNTFGNYDYRSAEDILEAVKPVLSENELVLTLEDEIVLIGDRYYVKATARIVDDAKTGSVWISAYAREAEDKKGMNSAQITGATSSYARKYALNGLFAIDDSKDADSDEHCKHSETRTSTTSNQALKASPNKPASATPNPSPSPSKLIRECAPIRALIRDFSIWA